VHAISQFYLMVDFFFVLSGFVLMHTYEDTITNASRYADFMRKRIARVYPLHALVTLAFLAASAFVAMGVIKLRIPEIFDWRLGPSHMLLLHAWGFSVHPGLNFASWSISAELFVYLLFPFFAAGTYRLGPVRTIFAAAAIGIGMTVLRTYLGLRPWTETTFDYGMLRAVPTFLAGVACHRLVMLYSLRCSWALAYTVAMGTAAAFFLGLPDLIIVALFPILVATTTAAQLNRDTSFLGHRWFVHLGDASYGIYMLHTPVIFACLALVRAYGLNSAGQLIGVAFAGLAFTTALALASFRWFESPARRRISGKAK
jgi:peptidoglycan/LPS O-acetylase OafA/YrhL